MDLTLKIIVGLMALMFLFMGATQMFAPRDAANAARLSLARGDLGGLFFTSAALLVLGLVQRRSEWFLAVALLMALIAIGRIVGFVLDGNPGAPTIYAFVGELIIAAVAVLASRRLGPVSFGRPTGTAK